MEKEGKVITRCKYPEIYDWLLENIEYYKKERKYYTLTSEGKINAYCDVITQQNITQFKYPFGYVSGSFDCSDSNYLTSLKGSPQEIGGDFTCADSDNLTSFIGFPKIVMGDVHLYSKFFSNNPVRKNEYKFYIDLWFEFLENISESEKWEYINNYKTIVDWWTRAPIIPKDVTLMFENKLKINTLLIK